MGAGGVSAVVLVGQVTGAYGPGSGVLGGVEVGHPGGRGGCGLGEEFVCVVEVPGGLFGFAEGGVYASGLGLHQGLDQDLPVTFGACCSQFQEPEGVVEVSEVDHLV
jgi:hypothetical protein